MKRKSLFFIFLLCFSSLFSLDRNFFNMKASGQVGFLNGTVNEYVFTDYCKNTDNKMSQLTWDVLAVPYFQSSVNLNFFKYLYIDFDGKIGIPSYSGVMQDYDWINSCDAYHPHWENDDPTQLTNYSKHRNAVENYYYFSSSIGINLNMGPNLVLTPYLGFLYDYIEFAAYDGYREYKSENFERHYFYGKTIAYAQESKSFITGINLNINFIRKIPIQACIQVVPGLGNMNALDLHLHPSKTIAYLDKYSNIFQIESKISAFYEFNKYNSLGVSSYLQYMPLKKGITGNGEIQPDGSLPKKFIGDKRVNGGAQRLLYTFSLIYQFNL